MGYKLLRLDELMSHEFSQIEGDWQVVTNRELLGSAKSIYSYSKARELLNSGELVLWTETPRSPLFKYDSDSQTWGIDPKFEHTLYSSAKCRYLSRLNMGSGVPTGSSVSNGLTQAAREASTQSSSLPTGSSSNVSSECTEPQPLPENSSKPKFEYVFEIAGPEQIAAKIGGYEFSLAATEQSAELSGWQRERTEKGYRYKVVSVDDETRSLNVKIAGELTQLTIHDITLDPIGSNVVRDKFVPVIPALQLGKRLGLPSYGFLYHFVGTELVHEWSFPESDKAVFNTTKSTKSSISDDLLSDKSQSALLLYWQKNNQAVTNQTLVHSAVRLANDELAAIDQTWLEENGIIIDVNALLEHVSYSESDLIEPNSTNTQNQEETVNKYTVRSLPNGERESWGEIAAKFQLSANELLDLNPQYADNPMSLAVGDELTVMGPKSNRYAGQKIRTYPDKEPVAYNKPAESTYSFDNTHLIDKKLLAVSSRQLVSSALPIVNLRSYKLFRIGVFFDGTGNNRVNDEHKEKHGDKSRTNIVRLFESYSVITGEQDKIYVSGVGTVDGLENKPEVIDAGDDEEKTSTQSGGVSQIFGSTGAFYKWQSLLNELHKMLRTESLVGEIHIEFDVFGFSRGAALARHFVNAISLGFPNYNQTFVADVSCYGYPNYCSFTPAYPITPNLFGLAGSQSSQRFDDTRLYRKSDLVSLSARFVGLFDTVGSFYWPGNENNGEFKLGLRPDCAEKVLQLCAHHEYRKNFPLTCLKKDGQLPANFFEEVFPGAHSDVGGGYPSKRQYNERGFDEQYGVPRNSSYNRILLHRESYGHKKIEMMKPTQWGVTDGGFSEFIKNQREVEAKKLQEKYVEQEIHTRVLIHGSDLLYYVLQPANNVLASLPLLRMYEIAKKIGIKFKGSGASLIMQEDWEHETDFESYWISLKNKEIGAITEDDWSHLIKDDDLEVLHRSHDTVINPGFDSFLENRINGITKDQHGKPKRNIFENK